MDDKPDKLLTYEAALAELGENLIKAHSADEALNCLLKDSIGIVITDVNMPGTDGFQLADMIREHPRFQDLAIIFISGALVSDADRLRGYDRGAVEYITIPIIPELLRAKVRMFAELHRKRRELQELNEELQRLSARIIETQDEERRRFARELHDSLSQQLTLAKITADQIKVPDARKQAAEVGSLIDEALRQVRSISHLLHPPMLDELGLEPAVHWYLEGLAKRSGMQTTLELEPKDFPRLPQKIEIALYRIIQETVTNAFRHSQGRNICVIVRQGKMDVTLAVCDDGKGIPDEVAALQHGKLGIGIGGMKQRVAELGGKLRLVNARPGTTVEVVIPLREATQSEKSSKRATVEQY